ncbi:MAG: ABC transporter ATP-binding protein [Bacteroidota bacterium]|nr:ABC transporter ATP-binding protein [Bacteroidota bacterium]
MKIIEVNNLCKVYPKKVEALKNVSLEFHEGEIFCLIGLNGAGKSTFVKILLELVNPTSGTIHYEKKIFGKNNLRNSVGYLPEIFSAPKHMTAYQLLHYLGELSGIKGQMLKTRIENALNAVEMCANQHRKFSTFSKGMQLRAGIAQAIIKDVPLYIMDEPTEGLDPLMRIKVREILQSLRSNGATVIINSHMLSEVELMADRVAIINKGQIIKSGNIAEMLKIRTGYEVQVGFKPAMENLKLIEKDHTWFCIVDDSKSLQLLLEELNKQSINVLSIKSNIPTLEEYFITNLGNGYVSDN